MKRLLAIVGVALMLGGCTAKRTAAPPAPKVAFEVFPKREAAAPAPTSAQILGAQTPEVRAAVKQHEENGKWPTYKTSGYVLYPYGEGPEPIVECAPMRTTDIQLQAGETVTDLAIGDQERWMATPASSGDPRDAVPHIALKPQAPGIETNLTIYTTKHIYHVGLRSHGRAMQEVEFYYPDELLIAMRDADANAPKPKQGNAQETAVDPPGDAGGSVVKVAAVDPSQLNFAYQISGPNVPWKPLRAFDDGSHVYIQIAQGMKSSEAPALLISAGGGTQMVNYRLTGDYFVVDRLFDQALLVSGVGRQQDRVTIAYAGGSR
jgi:type IV secretion system protein TrbG